jgi:sugar/nucleoside kinase (ribokinase family)
VTFPKRFDQDMQTQLDLLFLGHFAVDRNVVDGVAEIASGGGVYYGGIAAARLGARVGVVTRLHPADFPRLDDLRSEGIQVFATPAPATSGIENTYSLADMERRVCKPLAFAGAIQAREVPDVAARIYAVTPIIAGEVDLPLLKLLAGRAKTFEVFETSKVCAPAKTFEVFETLKVCAPGVALDVQGFVRVRVGDELLFRPWPDMAEGLAQIRYLKVDRAEAEALTGERDLIAAARKLASYGPREIVLTQSAGVTVYADGQISTAPFTPRSLAGRTGRGDTCFATYLAKRLVTSPEEACRWAGVVTTLKQERPGPWRGELVHVARLL